MSRLMLCGIVSWRVDSVRPAVRRRRRGQGRRVREEVRGKVTRDEKLPGKPVIGVHLSFSAAATDVGLKELAPLKNLTSLDLAGTQVTDVGLKELAPLKNLRNSTCTTRR